MWVLKSFGLLLVELPLMILGLIVVAIALPFRRTIPGTSKAFTEAEGTWELVRLPTWALLWDNPYDGVLGDKRGWWHIYTDDCRSFKSMYLWTAIRNPTNYFSRNIAGCNVSECCITKLWGQDTVVEEPGKGGWQLLKAVSTVSGKEYYRLFIVLPYFFDNTHAFMLDIGWKIKLSHNGTTKDARPQDIYKGNVFTISPWKGL